MASIFNGVPLVSKLPRYATFADRFRLDNPVAARFREITDAWVVSDSASRRSKLVTDLLDSRTAVGTFHELVVRQVLRRLYGDPLTDPPGLPVGDRTPDFSLRFGRRGRLVVFEATTVQLPIDQTTVRRRAIMSQLDRISGPWHLIPEWSWCRGLEDVPPRTVERAVRKAVSELSPDRKHSLQLRFGPAQFRATLLPASNHRQSIVSMDSSARAVFAPGVEAIKSDVRKKCARYRGLKAAGIPFVLAIGTGDPLVDWESAFDALYGVEQVTLQVDADGAVQAVEQGRLGPGGRITPRTDGIAVDTTLSAAWFVSWRFDGQDIYARVVHLPNPWAANPVRFGGQALDRISWRRQANGGVGIAKPRTRREIPLS